METILFGVDFQAGDVLYRALSKHMTLGLISSATKNLIKLALTEDNVTTVLFHFAQSVQCPDQ